MKRKTLQFFAFILIAVMLVGFAAPRVAAQNKRIGTVTSTVGLWVRDAAGTNGTNRLGLLPYGATVAILDETTVDGTVWYQVNGNTTSGNITGWSSGEFLEIREIVTDGTFDEYLDSQGFPESYREALTHLHDLYPNWQFEAVHTGLDWKAVVAAESKPGVKLVWRNSPSHYIDWNDPYIDVGRDGYNWVQASKNIVAYYLDPRNFLTDPYIFMFESQTFNAETQTEQGVENMIGHTFMKAENTFAVGDATYTHAQAILEAAQASGVSAYHLASRMLQEQGVTGSRLSLGTVPDYENYYNYFNIGAYPHSGNGSELNGAIYAKNAGWSDPLLSIKGGSTHLGNQFIYLGQDNVYFQNFNVVYAPSLYRNQYMTNVQAGQTESQMLRQAYDETTIQGSILFRIPVYENMPDAPVTQYGGRWHQNEVGWWYEYGTGGYPTSQWEWIDGKWYWFNAAGYMVTGWLGLGDTWYYLSESGYMVTGWLELDGNHYYFNADGARQSGWQVIDGARYFFDDAGVRQTGWLEQDGAWYYLRESGVMSTGWLELGGKHYYFNADGLRQSGWQVIDGARYFFDDAGVRQTGWLEQDGKRFYLNESGAMCVGWLELDGKRFYLDGGVMSTGWQLVNNTWYWLADTGEMLTGWQWIHNTWYYMDASGAMRTGWLLDGNTWYYLDASGAMQTGWLLLGNTWYYLDASGAMVTGWLLLGNTWYYLNDSGAMQTGWLLLGNTWYYLDASGAMQTGWLLLGNTWYYLNDSGAMVTGPQRIGGTVYLFNASGAWLG